MWCQGERVISLALCEQGQDFASDASAAAGEELTPAFFGAKVAESDAENVAADATDATDANYQHIFTWGASQTDLFSELWDDGILGGEHEESVIWLTPRPKRRAAFRLIGSLSSTDRIIDSLWPWDSILSADFSTALN